MDPSIELCRYKNSFDKVHISDKKPYTYITTNQVDIDNIKKLVLDDSSSSSSPISSTINDTPLANNPTNTSNNNIDRRNNPFYGVSPKPFINQDSVVLANIDMVFNFSRHTSGYILKQESKKYSFVTIDDGPGGYTQYIMYRNLSSYGYGITPISHPYDTNHIDMTHFNDIKGPSGKGDIKQDYKSFIKQVRDVEALGVDVVVGNSVGNSVGDIDYLYKLLIALGTVKIGGTFISKVSDINNSLMIQLLYITSQCFDRISLFKPLSTDVTNGVYYIVAQDAKKNNIEWKSYLTNVSDKINNNKNIKQLLDVIPENFIEWVNGYLVLINNYIDSLNNLEGEIYDTYKCKAIWNLPQI